MTKSQPPAALHIQDMTCANPIELTQSRLTVSVLQRKVHCLGKEGPGLCFYHISQNVNVALFYISGRR